MVLILYVNVPGTVIGAYVDAYVTITTPLPPALPGMLLLDVPPHPPPPVLSVPGELTLELELPPPPMPPVFHEPAPPPPT